jgi:hypothetical protein
MTRSLMVQYMLLAGGITLGIHAVFTLAVGQWFPLAVGQWRTFWSHVLTTTAVLIALFLVFVIAGVI